MWGVQTENLGVLVYMGVAIKIKQEGQTAGFGPCFHLPGQPILVPVL